MFWSLVAVACTAIVVHGCRALLSSPRGLHRRHPPLGCMVRSSERVDCREKGVSQAPSPGQISSVPIALKMGLHVQNHALLYNILSPCQLCVHLVYKGAGTSHEVTRGLQHAWISTPLNKGMSGIPELLEFSSICLNPE